MEAATQGVSPPAQRATVIVERRWVLGAAVAALSVILALTVALIIAVSAGGAEGRSGPGQGQLPPMSAPAIPGEQGQGTQGAPAPLTPGSLQEPTQPNSGAGSSSGSSAN